MRRKTLMPSYVRCKTPDCHQVKKHSPTALNKDASILYLSDQLLSLRSASISEISFYLSDQLLSLRSASISQISFYLSDQWFRSRNGSEAEMVPKPKWFRSRNGSAAEMRCSMCEPAGQSGYKRSNKYAFSCSPCSRWRASLGSFFIGYRPAFLIGSSSLLVCLVH